MELSKPVIIAGGIAGVITLVILLRNAGKSPVATVTTGGNAGLSSSDVDKLFKDIQDNATQNQSSLTTSIAQLQSTIDKLPSGSDTANQLKQQLASLQTQLATTESANLTSLQQSLADLINTNNATETSNISAITSNLSSILNQNQQHETDLLSGFFTSINGLLNQIVPKAVNAVNNSGATWQSTLGTISQKYGGLSQNYTNIGIGSPFAQGWISTVAATFKVPNRIAQDLYVQIQSNPLAFRPPGVTSGSTWNYDAFAAALDSLVSNYNTDNTANNFRHTA